MWVKNQSDSEMTVSDRIWIKCTAFLAGSTDYLYRNRNDGIFPFEDICPSRGSERMKGGKDRFHLNRENDTLWDHTFSALRTMSSLYATMRHWWHAKKMICRRHQTSSQLMSLYLNNITAPIPSIWCIFCELVTDGLIWQPPLTKGVERSFFRPTWNCACGAHYRLRAQLVYLFIYSFMTVPYDYRQ